MEAIVLAHQAWCLPCPVGVRAHSTRGVSSSWALARGASIADICKAAGWATPNTTPSPPEVGNGDVTSRHHSCCTTAVRPGHTVSAPPRKTVVRLRNKHANCHWLVLLTLF